MQTLISAPEADISVPARDILWRLVNLRVGSPVPELFGNDAHGNEVRLSHYRGRVVMLRFWSAGDPGALASMRRDAAVVSALGDHPFTLLGVNGDADRTAYLARRSQHDLPGTQIYDGPLDADIIDEVRERRERRIANAAQSWHQSGGAQRVYLIDSRGILRAINPATSQVQSLVLGLVGERYLSTRAAMR